MVLDWTKAPGAVNTQTDLAPGQSLLERLAMACCAMTRAPPTILDAAQPRGAVGIRSPLFTGTLPPLGNPLSPLWTPSFMPPFDPTAGTTRSLLAAELDPATMTPVHGRAHC